MSPLCFLFRRDRHATVLNARNNFEFQFLSEADFGSVVAVNSHFFEDAKEFAAKFGVALVARDRFAWIGMVPVDGVVKGTKESNLLSGSDFQKRFAKQCGALHVYIV